MQGVADVNIVRGLRVLFYDGVRLYGTRGLEIVVSEDRGVTWRALGWVQLPSILRVAARVRIAQRLGRLEVYKLQRCGEHLVALARGGVYVGTITEGMLRVSFPVTRGSRPISLAIGPRNEVLFGEYHGNPERGPMRIYRSRDCRDWEVAYEFPAGSIRHIHGIYYDSYALCYWVLVGDEGPEPGVARCSLDFGDVHFVRRGSQQVRAYSLIVRREGLVFATDTEREANAVYFMDREGRTLEKLHAIENSCFHSGIFGGWMVFSTVCEPSPTNDQRFLHVWATRDGDRWLKVAVYEKDRLPFLFQYGNVFFPEGKTGELQELIYSGTALGELDNATAFVPVASLEARLEDESCSLGRFQSS